MRAPDLLVAIGGTSKRREGRGLLLRGTEGMEWRREGTEREGKGIPPKV